MVDHVVGPTVLPIQDCLLANYASHGNVIRHSKLQANIQSLAKIGQLKRF